MTSCLVLLAPSANHVYAAQAPEVCAAELELTCPGHGPWRQETIAGVHYLRGEVDPGDPAVASALARASAALACFTTDDLDVPPMLRPVQLPRVDALDEDLVTIPKYRGKTNEQFTRLLVNLTLASLQGSPARRRDKGERLAVLDPLCGRGTTLQTAWIAGHDAYGVELDPKAVEALAAHVTTWLRRKRLKHSAGMTKVRREGRSLGRRFDAEIRLDPPLHMGVFTGDGRDSARLWGQRTFDAVVCDAPYGVVHGAQSETGRDRSPAELLAEALPVWAGQLRHGGALGCAWNTYGLAREDLTDLLADAGLEPLHGPAHNRLAHRVDSSIHRDVVVAVKP